MEIRKANKNDINRINDLLFQVHAIHATGRPDIFKKGLKKYTDEELLKIMDNEQTPIFVCLIDNYVVGYAFTITLDYGKSPSCNNIKSLYIDDLCVDEKYRSKHIGKKIFDHVCNYAKENGFYEVSLNVWDFNENAKEFYEKMGMRAQKITMEKIL